LVFHLKTFFKQHKQIGSKDRKIISSIVYQYYRCVHLFDAQQKLSSAIIQSVFLCETKSTSFLECHDASLNEQVTATLSEKLRILGLNPAPTFHFDEWLSEEIDSEMLAGSMFVQPDLFLRIRPGRKEYVIQKLNAASIQYDLIDDTCLRLASAQDLSDILKNDRDVVIQDMSSQKVFDYFKNTSLSKDVPLHIWDCCAARGGKSILLTDILKSPLKITASDVRPSILHNLKERFRHAGISLNNIFTADLTNASPLKAIDLFDVVICDVPCTGSGTWSRTPEQYFSFSPQTLDELVEKQSRILTTTLKHVKKGGYLIYITCSVFEKENELQLKKMREDGSFDLMEMRYCKGYTEKADTLFVAVMKKSV